MRLVVTTHRKDEPPSRKSWEVCGRRLRLFGVLLGYVNARGRTDALDRARRRWPEERRLVVYPKALQ